MTLLHPDLPKYLIEATKLSAKEWLKRFSRSQPDLTADQQIVLAELLENGIAVVPEYWSRDKAFEIRDQLKQYIVSGEDQDLDGGAYVRHWSNRPIDYDQGVKRLYHPDAVLPELKEHRFNPFIMDIVHAYYGTPFYSQGLMYQYNLPNTQTGAFHVDGFKPEFKTFVYLDDVTEDNGPFTYIPKTHKAYWRRFQKEIAPKNAVGNRTNFAEDELEGQYEAQAKLYTAPAGTLILADVRGFHRGAPQKTGERNALVNYIMPKPGELTLEK